MDSTKYEREAEVKRIDGGDLRATRIRENDIRTAFNRVPGALSCRPRGETRAFDNTARTSGASSPWETLQAAARATSRAAAKDGRPVVIETTRTRIHELYELLLADALSPLPPESDVDVVQAVMRQAAVQGEADVAEYHAVAKPTCRQTLLNLAQKVREHIRSLTVIARSAEHAALNPHATGMRVCK